MSLIGVLSSDETINSIITNAFEKNGNGQYDLHFLTNVEATLEFLNFDLPEIVIINFDDQELPITGIIEQVRSDAWLHNFGIVGLYDQTREDESHIFRRAKDLNLLVLLDHIRVRTHIVTCVQIIEQNRQIIFQRDISAKLVDKASGSFVIANDTLAVPIYAGIAVTNLAQRGLIDPDGKMRLQLCLSELIINGIEHGNCGITYDEKTLGMDRGLSVVELVAEKCRDPEIAAKRVTFEWEIGTDDTKFAIRDEGDGFDVHKFREKLKAKDEEPYALHGRGIKMARAMASRLAYNKKGNVVTLWIDHNHSVAIDAPVGFSGEEVVFPKRGDSIFQEGEVSDFLYYISSGEFSVYTEDNLVGKLTPADIFMGEMSFLLNNQRSASVVADRPGKLVKITRKSFVSVVKEYPHYGIFLSKLLAHKLVRTNAISAGSSGQSSVDSVGADTDSIETDAVDSGAADSGTQPIITSV
jgi:hypothetical protein